MHRYRHGEYLMLVGLPLARAARGYPRIKAPLALGMVHGLNVVATGRGGIA